ncbi:MAG: tyrosine-type recombinase/integrase [Parcubacteria group bacterium]|nr:tyrosine-type recombinase/integrase [Parcubacteria group bacterium]MCR4342917.1 tyrosine-type recombinase/integrase [Patescibacteria group bacterium]
MSHNIIQLKKDFLEHLEVERGRSLKTILNYDHYLNRFLSQSKLQNVEDISDETVRQYRLWLNRIEPTLSKKTQNYHLVALRAFLKYLSRRDIKSLSAERIDLVKVPERDLDLITEDELERLLDAPITPPDKGLKSLRDKAILELLFSTGLRVSELCNLNIDSINLKREEFSIRGKGGKVRVVFLSDTAKQSLKDYLDARADINEALFIRISKGGEVKESVAKKNGSRRIPLDDRPLENRFFGETSESGGVGKSDSRRISPSAEGGIRPQEKQISDSDHRLTPRSVERIIKHYAIKAGISKKVTPHIIRHCFATDLLSAGADIRSVQSLLGHSNISTTQIYTHITDKKLHDVHKAFHDKRRG